MNAARETIRSGATIDTYIIQTIHDIKATLESGQTFAFYPVEGGYAGIVDGRPAEIGKPADFYEIKCKVNDAGFWRRYFDLDRSYESMLGGFIDQGGGGNFLGKCVKSYRGLRLLRQPVWETICEFIISANNHQRRIESIYGRLSEYYGEKVYWEGRVYDAFPTADKLSGSSENELRMLGLGYRAPYLLDTARRINEDGPPDLDRMNYDDAIRFLMKYRGVGEKVADCVLLFSSNHQNAFPVDVWIEKALREHYGMSGSRHTLKRLAQELFGDAAGVAQQFLFHGMRSRLSPVM